jgi:hypothetical protein
MEGSVHALIQGPRTWLLTVVVLLLAVSPMGAVVGCADSCGDVNCGSGLSVSWRRQDLPSAHSYVLCVNGSCHVVVAQVRKGRVSVAPGVAPALKVQVELRLRNADKKVVASYRGGGTRTGRCCRYLQLHAQRGGQLVKAAPD